MTRPRQDPSIPGYRFGWIVVALCCLGLAALAGVLIDLQQFVRTK